MGLLRKYVGERQDNTIRPIVENFYQIIKVDAKGKYTYEKP